MTWQIGRLERDLNISIETLALFIRSWLIVAPSLPDSAQIAAHARSAARKGREPHS
jgi:hypothetical protein